MVTGILCRPPRAPRCSEQDVQKKMCGRLMTDLKTPESATKRGALLPDEETSSHIPIRPLYTPADLAARDWNYDRDAGYPGEFRYTRGVQATMYRGRLWTMRQYAGMGDAEESNSRYKYCWALPRALPTGVSPAGAKENFGPPFIPSNAAKAL